jgi:hypothetical protein
LSLPTARRLILTDRGLDFQGDRVRLIGDWILLIGDWIFRGIGSGRGLTDRGLDFQGDRVREGFKGRVADRNGIGPLVSPNSHDSLTGLRLEEPVNKDLGAKI